MMARLALALIAALLACSPHASARQVWTRIASAETFKLDARLVAASQTHGYGVVHLRAIAEPGLPSDLPIELEFHSSYPSTIVADWRGIVRPGEQVEARVLVPTSTRPAMPINVRFGNHHVAHLAVAAQATVTPDGTRPVFHIAPTDHEPSRLLAFAEELSGKQLPTTAPWPATAPAPSRPRHMPWMPPTGGPAGRMSSAYALVTLNTADIPRRWIELTSAVVIVVEEPGALEPAALEVLLDHARAGGVLVLCGGAPGVLAERVPALAPLLERRFAVVGLPIGEPPRAVVHTLGLGKLVTSDSGVALPGEPQNPGLVQALWWCTETERGWLQDAHGPESPLMAAAEVPRSDLLPREVLVALCIAMAIAIGPVSYIVALRRKRPVLLLVVVPAVSFGIAMLLVILVVVRTGFDIDAHGASLAVLDQRTGDAAVGEARALTAGFTFTRGLRPAAGVAVLPASDKSAHSWHYTQGGPMPRIEEDGALFTGSYLPPRQRAFSTVLSVRRTRQRLEVSRGAAGPEIVNGFESAIEDLVLRDPEGRWFALAGIGRGATASLSAIEEADARARIAAMQLTPDDRIQRLAEVPPATYVARLSDGALIADVGVPLRWSDQPRTHGVIGILPAEGW